MGFGVDENPSRTEIYERGRELGLAPCPPNVAPEMLAQNKVSIGEYSELASSPIYIKDGNEEVPCKFFYYCSEDMEEKGLRTLDHSDSTRYNFPEARFTFRIIRRRRDQP